MLDFDKHFAFKYFLKLEWVKALRDLCFQPKLCIQFHQGCLYYTGAVNIWGHSC